MASLCVLRKVYESLSPNIFITATNNTHIMVGAISKYAVEHTLLTYEMYLYNAPFTCSSLLTLPVIYCIPAYRTYKAIVNKNIQIINM